MKVVEFGRKGAPVVVLLHGELSMGQPEEYARRVLGLLEKE